MQAFLRSQFCLSLSLLPTVRIIMCCAWQKYISREREMSHTSCTKIWATNYIMQVIGCAARTRTCTQTYSIILHVNWIWVNAWIVLATKSYFIIYKWCAAQNLPKSWSMLCAERTEHITYPQARLLKGNRIWVPSSKSKANVCMVATHIGWRSQTRFAYRFTKSSIYSMLCANLSDSTNSAPTQA